MPDISIYSQKSRKNPEWFGKLSSFFTSGSRSNGSRPAPPDDVPVDEEKRKETEDLRISKFQNIFQQPAADISALRNLLWSGAPNTDLTIRAKAWQLLLGILPNFRERQDQGIQRKRREYFEMREEIYDKEDRSEEEMVLLRQIKVDIPRTNPGLPIFSHPRLQILMERSLYIWSVRHPASSYVQGINDLLTPFIVILLGAELNCEYEDVDMENVSDEILENVEAGAYWCLQRVLADIQDHYTFGQPGIQRMVLRLKEIVKRIDEGLYQHLEQQNVDFLQFSFRWMNCLLLREFPIACVIRLWDTYIAEGADGFSSFHVYVCAVFLVYWSPQLKLMDFQQLMLFMQKFPTAKWSVKEMETLLAEAYVLKSLFHSCPRHLNSSPSST